MDPNQIEAWKEIIPESTMELLLNPVAKGVGYTVAGLFYAVFGKIAKYGAAKNSEIDDLINKTAKKIKEIPENKQTNANNGIMLKGFEDSRYVLNDGLMREYFSNLISKAANKDYSDKITPYFSTVLGNLSVADALFLQNFREGKRLIPAIAIAKIRFVDTHDSVSFSDYMQDIILEYNDDSKPTLKEHSEQIDTLESLGILRRSYGISNESEKDDLSKMEQLVDSMDLKQKLNGKFNINLNSANNHIFITKHQYDNYKFIPGSLELTNLGKSFARIVLL